MFSSIVTFWWENISTDQARDICSELSVNSKDSLMKDGKALLGSGSVYRRIDLWFELFFGKEINHVIEWLPEIKTAEKNIVINFFLYSKIIFFTQFKLVINNKDVIACQLEFLKTR